jgi:hypothetical protein
MVIITADDLSKVPANYTGTLDITCPCRRALLHEELPILMVDQCLARPYIHVSGCAKAAIKIPANVYAGENSVVLLEHPNASLEVTDRARAIVYQGACRASSYAFVQGVAIREAPFALTEAERQQFARSKAFGGPREEATVYVNDDGARIAIVGASVTVKDAAVLEGIHIGEQGMAAFMRLPEPDSMPETRRLFWRQVRETAAKYLSVMGGGAGN